MITYIELKNFKSHKYTKLETANISILAGQNGVGKSSLIQSLLLLRQTHQKSRLNAILDLNAPLCFIGKTSDLVYQFPEKEDKLTVEIGLTSSDKTFVWTFDASNESTFLNLIDNNDRNSGYELLSIFNNDFQYISAGRAANYLVDNYAVEILKQISISEGKGELTAQFLYYYGKSQKVEDSLMHPNEADPFLLAQVTAWEREISPGVNIYPVQVGDRFDIRFGFYNELLGETDHFSSANVGFGLSYALPIIVSILSSKPGSLLLIENPEAHLHPYGQSKLAEMICLAAQAGIQLIVETHSDHIVNGVLVQCKKFEQTGKGLDKNLLRIYSFDRDEKEHKTQVTPIGLESGGRMVNRPITFFDQIGKDIRELL